MYWASLLPIVTLPAALAFPWSSHMAEKRGSGATDATLYAYGTNISGFPLFYGVDDAFIYISSSNDSTLSLSPVTWDIPSMSLATSTSTNATVTNGTSPGALCIHPDNGLFDQVNVVSDSTVSANGTITGLTTYGKQLIYYDGSSFQAEFWARPEEDETTGNTVWALLWNSDNESQTGAVPVTIKTLAPSSSS